MSDSKDGSSVYGATGGELLHEDRPTGQLPEKKRSSRETRLADSGRLKEPWDIHSEISDHEKVERWRKSNFGIDDDNVDVDVVSRASDRQSSTKSFPSSRSSRSQRARALTKEIQLSAKATILKKQHEAAERKRKLQFKMQRELEEEEYQQQQMQIQVELETARAIGKIYSQEDSDPEKGTSSLSAESIAQAIIRAAELQTAQLNSTGQSALEQQNQPVKTSHQQPVKIPSRELEKGVQQQTVKTPTHQFMENPLQLQTVKTSLQQEQVKRPPPTQQQNGEDQSNVDLVEQRPPQDQIHGNVQVVKQRPPQDQIHSNVQVVKQRPPQDQIHSNVHLVEQRPPQDQIHGNVQVVKQRPPQDQIHSNVHLVEQRPSQDQIHGNVQVVKQRPPQDQIHGNVQVVKQRPPQDQIHSNVHLVEQRPPQDQIHGNVQVVKQRPPQDQIHSNVHLVEQRPPQDQIHSSVGVVKQRPLQNQIHSNVDMVKQRQQQDQSKIHLVQWPPQNQTFSRLNPVQQRAPQDQSKIHLVEQWPPQEQTQSMANSLQLRPTQEQTYFLMNPVQQGLPQYQSQNAGSEDYMNQGKNRITGTMDQNPWLSHTPQVSANMDNMDMLNRNSTVNDNVEVVEDDVYRGDREVRSYDKRPPVSSDNQMLSNLASAILKQSMHASLPQRQMKSYNGDPLEYCSFIESFRYCIEAKTDDEMDKLYFLDQHTIGEPNHVVKGYLSKGPKGFEEAMKHLKKRFGDKYVIAEAFKKKARGWQEVKRDDAKAWSSYAIFLGEYLHTMENLECLNEIDHSATVKVLLEKIPYNIRHQWRIKVDTIQEVEGRLAGFQDYVSFVERQMRIVSNPVYGDIQGTAKENKNPSSKVNRRRLNFSTNVIEESKEASGSKAKESPSKWCYNCDNKLHNTTDCKKLLKKPYEDRIAVIMKKGLCFACLKKGAHQAKDCNKKLKCRTCQKTHPTVLHRDKKPEEKQEQPVEASRVKKQEDKREQPAEASTLCGLTGAGSCMAAMSVVPVVVKSKQTGKCVTTFALLDSKSTAVFCAESLKEKLAIKGVKTKLRIQTLNGVKEVNTCKLRDLEVADKQGNINIELPDVYIQDNIPVSQEDIVTKADIQPWTYLSEVNVPEVNQKVELLIGNNVPQALEPVRIIHSEKGGPYACQTSLGWEIHGLVKKVTDVEQRASVHRICVHKAEDEANLNRQMVRMFNYDFSERLQDDVPQHSIEDRRFLEIVSNSDKLVDGHHEIALPLRDPDKAMNDNRLQAVQRAEHLKRKLRKNPQYGEEYKQYMNEVLSNGYAEKVPPEEIEGEEGKKWYIPHHAVHHPQKGKIRIVYDCAATFRGCSLNSELLQGPDLTNTLVGVLLRFRQEPVALMADIKGMFHQVKVPKADRDYQRFLWWPDGNLDLPLEEYRMTTHIFGATSAPACANFALRKTLLDNQHSEQVRNSVRNFYVDDALQSVCNVKEGIRLARDLTSACSHGGFSLSKWISNSREVLDSVPKDDLAAEVKELNLEQDKLPVERALGIQWQVELDTFGFKIEIKDRPATRRGILSIASSIFDPLGFVSAAILPARRIMQDLTRLKIGWDEEIPVEYKKKWQQWVIDLPKLTNLSVPRCYKPDGFEKLTSVQLHHFCDASEIGYGTVSYLRLENDKGDKHCAFVMSKSRVAPLKQITVPRLELTAATVAVRVNSMIQKELDMSIDKTFYWTDSMSVLKYINNESRRFQTFVANRVATIRDSSDPSQWRYISTEQNPADDCSRGMSVEKFVVNTRWFAGPEFLEEPESVWSVKQEVNIDPEPDDPEIKKRVIVNATLADETAATLDKLFRHYSNWHSLKRAIAWMLRLKKILQHRVKQKPHGASASVIERPELDDQTHKYTAKNLLSLSDMQEAEHAILACVQRKFFSKEITTLTRDSRESDDGDQHMSSQRPKKSGNSVQKTSPIYRLDPRWENGLLRVGGRLCEAAMPEEAKHPVILPRNSYVSELILHHAHEITGHSGRNHLLSQLHQHYWIVGANSAARKIIGKCITCRRHRAKVQNQKMANLPADRLKANEPPFTRVGMDFFGPVQVKQGRSMVKRYGVVFTCLSVRAVHIEKADSLDTDSCISAIRRFVARRGQVRVIRSDNGTNIVGAQRELCKEVQNWNQAKICDTLLQRNIEWKFNPPGGSHFGGVWERQIRTIRSLMCSLLKQQTLTDESLQTLFCEIEAIINSRPLTRISSDAHDMEPLTPNHLLLMKPPSLSPVNLDPGAVDMVNIRRRWKQVQYLANVFWRRWLKEYLVHLQERQKWVAPQANIKVGDIVLIANEAAPRNLWQMGRVIETIPDKQGYVRQAKLRTKNNVLLRPIHKLCLLLESEVESSQITEPGQESSSRESE